LESFIQTKNELSELLAAMNKAVGGRISLDRLLQLLQEDSEVPPAVVNATVEAEKTKEFVLQGDEEKIDEATLRSLAGELGTVTEYLRQRLRSYQLEIVDAAISSTLASVKSDGRAGIVSQVSGSGLSMTLLAYLARCRETTELANLPCIILVDRVDVGRALAERACDLPNASELMKMVMPSSALELKRTLEAPNSRPVVTTWQMLRMLDREQKFTFSCLVICFDLVRTGTPDFDIKSLFPRGNFILFASTPLQQDECRSELFGNLIRKYDFLAALADGYMLPVRIEQHQIDMNDSELGGDSEEKRQLHETSAERIHAIASTLFEDFRDKMRRGIHQAVLVTRSRAAVVAFTHELSQLKDKHARSIDTDTLFVSQLGNRDDMHHLYNDRESPIVWISTIERLVGVDLGPGVICYVTCKVSQDAQHRLVSMVARPRGNAKEAFIVDYASNHWDSMLASK
jgi:hypothetical protein